MATKKIESVGQWALLNTKTSKIWRTEYDGTIELWNNKREANRCRYGDRDFKVIRVEIRTIY